MMPFQPDIPDPIVMNIHREFCEAINSRQLVLSHRGKVTQETLVSLLAMAERNLSSTAEGLATVRKVYRVLMETLQNTARHGIDLILRNSVPVTAHLVLLRTAEAFIITSGNPIRKEQAHQLRGRLDKLRGMDEAGLRKWYRHHMRTVKSHRGGGAGLGIIDIARNTGNNIKYTIHALDSDFSFFYIQSSISRITV